MLRKGAQSKGHWTKRSVACGNLTTLHVSQLGKSTNDITKVMLIENESQRERLDPRLGGTKVRNQSLSPVRKQTFDLFPDPPTGDPMTQLPHGYAIFQMVFDERPSCFSGRKPMNVVPHGKGALSLRVAKPSLCRTARRRMNLLNHSKPTGSNAWKRRNGDAHFQARMKRHISPLFNAHLLRLWCECGQVLSRLEKTPHFGEGFLKFNLRLNDLRLAH